MMNIINWTLRGDDPTRVAAPFRIFDKTELEAMPQHSQFMLMNTTKSGDYYAEYSDVVMEDLLKAAGIRADATTEARQLQPVKKK